MGDYESKYEEYKKSLLQNHWFIKKLHEEYRGSLRVEKDFIDENGVLWKFGVLHQVCGACLVFFSSLYGRTDTFGIIVRIVIAIVGIACFLWALHIGNKFKRSLGEKIFYSFRYHQHFKDHVQKEKDKETDQLLRDMLNYMESVPRWAKSISTMSEEETKSLLEFLTKEPDIYTTRYENLSRYGRFASDIKNDYYFNAEIQKDIDKYI